MVEAEEGLSARVRSGQGRARRLVSFLKENARYLISILASMALTAAILLVPLFFPVKYSELGDWGYPGVFLTTLLASATVIFPSPTLVAPLIAGSYLNPLLVGLVAGLGAALGEATGYLVGYGGSALAARSRYYGAIRRSVERFGLLAIFVLAFIPNPLFDLAGIAAGTTRIPYWRFLLACFLGKTVRFILIAYMGRWWPWLLLGANLGGAVIS
jgi:membrane protein YqaA with SNARE-associated domain